MFGCRVSSWQGRLAKLAAMADYRLFVETVESHDLVVNFCYEQMWAIIIFYVYYETKLLVMLVIRGNDEF